EIVAVEELLLGLLIESRESRQIFRIGRVNVINVDDDAWRLDGHLGEGERIATAFVCEIECDIRTISWSKFVFRVGNERDQAHQHGAWNSHRQLPKICLFEGMTGSRGGATT